MKNFTNSGRKAGIIKLPFSVILTFFIACFSLSANAQTMSKLAIQLLLNTNGGSNNTADGCLVLYADNFTAGLGPEDSYKFTNLDENLAINCSGTNLSIEGRPTIVEADTVPLKIWQFRQSNYYLQFKGSSFLPGVTAVLKDNYLQQDQVIDLYGTTLLQFNITADTLSAQPDRFCLVFNRATTLPVHFAYAKAFQKDKGVLLEWKLGDETNVDSYVIEKSVNGTTFTKQVTISVASNIINRSWFDNTALTGKSYYRIKSISKSGVQLYSQVMKVDVINGSATVSVYPNPVKGNQLGLIFNNVEKGRYTVKLFSANGQQVYTSTIDRTNAASGFHSIRLNQTLVKGIYRLCLINGPVIYNQSVLVD